VADKSTETTDNKVEKGTKMKKTVLVKSQFKTYGPKLYTEDGTQCRIAATVRYDDQCGNGHNSFSITGETWRKSGVRWMEDTGGCIHEAISRHFPELAPFVKWHLFDATGPMHYISNTVYLAGDRDCHGLLKGEFRQHTSRGQQNGGVAGVPNWEMKFPAGTATDVYAATKPAAVVVEWQPYGRTGKGKERDLDAARHCAVWPEATDEELTAPGLEQRLAARLPALVEAFAADMEKLGFVY